MKVLFLDIDGVLNNDSTWNSGIPENELGVKVNRIQKIRCVSYEVALSLGMLDRGLISLVKRVVDELNLTVVLSSTWRFHKGIKELFKTHFDLEIFDITPRLDNLQRGDEIQRWLNRYPKVTKFVILDDDSDMAHLKEHLVQTTFKTGVTEEHIEMKLNGLE